MPSALRILLQLPIWAMEVLIVEKSGNRNRQHPGLWEFFGRHAARVFFGFTGSGIHAEGSFIASEQSLFTSYLATVHWTGEWGKRGLGMKNDGTARGSALKETCDSNWVVSFFASRLYGIEGIWGA